MQKVNIRIIGYILVVLRGVFGIKRETAVAMLRRFF